MMLALRDVKQIDLANYLGKQRQNMNRMLKTGSAWSFNDMVRAAKFFDIDVDDLMRPDLSQEELAGERDGGGSVAPSPYAPVFSGPRFFVMPDSPDPDMFATRAYLMPVGTVPAAESDAMYVMSDYIFKSAALGIHAAYILFRSASLCRTILFCSGPA